MKLTVTATVCVLQVFIYVHRHASLMDTTCPPGPQRDSSLRNTTTSDTGQDTASDTPLKDPGAVSKGDTSFTDTNSEQFVGGGWPVLRYTFNSMQDIQLYWFKLQCICFNSPIGQDLPSYLWPLHRWRGCTF